MIATDLQTLRRAICANPADELARLAFFDAMEEVGESQAQGWRALHDMAAESVGKNSKGGLLSFFTLDDVLLHQLQMPSWVSGYVVRRGWIAEVSCALGDWLKHGAALVAEHPVERVEVTDRSPNAWTVLPEDPSVGVYWWNDDHRWTPRSAYCHLPGRIARRLTGTREQGSAISYYAATLKAAAVAALADLNLACLAWARVEARLPPLT